MNRNLNLCDKLVRFIRDPVIDHGDFLREACNLQAMVMDEGDQLLILGWCVGMTPAEPKRHAGFRRKLLNLALKFILRVEQHEHQIVVLIGLRHQMLLRNPDADLAQKYQCVLLLALRLANRHLQIEV